MAAKVSQRTHTAHFKKSHFYFMFFSQLRSLSLLTFYRRVGVVGGWGGLRRREGKGGWEETEN